MAGIERRRFDDLLPFRIAAAPRHFSKLALPARSPFALASQRGTR
jgi:hypothetical protein